MKRICCARAYMRWWNKVDTKYVIASSYKAYNNNVDEEKCSIDLQRYSVLPLLF